MFSTPVLFLIFNRPETTKIVFEAIRAAKPKQLFIAADGPRAEKKGEKERCNEARQIATNVDWECEVKTLFQTENIGCGGGPVEGMNWFFENVEEGIILEDDCFPSPSFFKFCEVLLEKYRFDERIHSIAGTNLLDKFSENQDGSYFFSIQSGIWGWATWRRAWKEYDFYVSKWADPMVQKSFNACFSNPNERVVYARAFDKTLLRNNISWWDYQWVFSRIINARFGIIPKVNLVSNIGFGPGATHTYNPDSEISNLPAKALNFPLEEPKIVMPDKEYDELLSITFYPNQKKKSLKTKLKSIVKNLKS